MALLRRGRNRAKNGICLVGENENEDEKRKLEEMHQQSVNQMIKSAEGSAELLHKIAKPTAWR